MYLKAICIILSKSDKRKALTLEHYSTQDIDWYGYLLAKCENPSSLGCWNR